MSSGEMGKQLSYIERLPITQGEAAAIFTTRDDRAICDALVKLTFHDDDWHWVQERCLEFAVTGSPAVRTISATCLAHLARFHGSDVDKCRIMAAALRLLKSEPYAAGFAEDALEIVGRFARRSKPTAQS